MSQPSLDQAWLQIAVGLSTSMPGELQYQRLVHAICDVLPCDAVALMQFNDGELVPVAAIGLAPELIGQRFLPNKHPRLQAILRERDPVRFPADSELPDPFDGWLAIDRERNADVHSCMGCSLYVDRQLVGVLTLDALNPGQFDDVDDVTIAAFAALAAATIRNVAMIRALEHSREQQHELAQELVRDARRREGELIGKSAAMNQLRKEISIVAGTDLAVLIMGETGTGKELVARTLHAQSQRNNQALIHINCAALPEQIAESELFGHVKGAFTGATTDRAGKFELADGGTLFLDEIGELPLSLQAKLLRALQQGEIQRVGSDKLLRVNVRLIAATNRDLLKEVEEGRFRSDLYHRLNVYPILMPPLRAHIQDIEPLSSYFLEQAHYRLGCGQIGLHPDALIAMKVYDWPGNVRELEHLLTRASLKATQINLKRPLILAEHLDLPTTLVQQQNISPHDIGTNDQSAPLITANTPFHGNLRDAVDDFQRDIIQGVLQEEEGNWSAAARHLQLDRANLIRLAQRLGLKT